MLHVKFNKFFFLAPNIYFGFSLFLIFATVVFLRFKFSSSPCSVVTVANSYDRPLSSIPPSLSSFLPPPPPSCPLLRFLPKSAAEYRLKHSARDFSLSIHHTQSLYIFLGVSFLIALTSLLFYSIRTCSFSPLTLWIILSNGFRLRRFSFLRGKNNLLSSK